MKNVICRVVILSVVSVFTKNVCAQVPLPVPGIKPGITLGAQMVYSMPQGDFKDRYKYGIGGEAFGGIGWGSTFLIATVGISGFSAESGNNQGTLTYIP